MYKLYNFIIQAGLWGWKYTQNPNEKPKFE